jgi:septal ring factor EnvC (AmiA/AmiB activator)
MESLEQRLAQLEASTTRLVKLVAELRGERDRLRQQLHATAGETRQLREDVTALRREREVIRRRLLVIDESLAKALVTDSTGRRDHKGSVRRDESAVEELTLFS